MVKRTALRRRVAVLQVRYHYYSRLSSHQVRHHPSFKGYFMDFAIWLFYISRKEGWLVMNLEDMNKTARTTASCLSAGTLNKRKTYLILQKYRIERFFNE